MLKHSEILLGTLKVKINSVEIDNLFILMQKGYKLQTGIAL